jgi:hypothetical protein
MFNAQLRKETKYTGLLDDINATEVWKPVLFTLEVGARGLVGFSTQKTFVRLGFTSSQAKVLCKRLSSVVVRCSYQTQQPSLVAHRRIRAAKTLGDRRLTLQHRAKQMRRFRSTTTYRFFAAMMFIRFFTLQMLLIWSP